MNHIIVPVDLSQNSKEALKYAAKLASKSGADIMVVYCYSLLQRVVTHTTRKKDTIPDPEAWIVKRVDKLKSKFPGLIINYKIIKGDVLDNLRKMVDVTKADFVVMGCQGENESMDNFLGSTSGSLVKTTDIPVILIPPRVKFKGIDKVVFAAKNTFVQYMGSLEPIVQIKQVFNPHIQLLHLGEAPDPMPEQSFSILPLVNDITRYGNDNFNESINEYLSQHHADLLCVIRRKRGFFEKLLGRSGTPASKFNVAVPILVLIGDEY